MKHVLGGMSFPELLMRSIHAESTCLLQGHQVRILTSVCVSSSPNINLSLSLCVCVCVCVCVALAFHVSMVSNCMDKKKCVVKLELKRRSKRGAEVCE